MSDIRNERTEQAIRQAMLDLLKKKPFDCLSVTEVATAAGVSRSTFYAHFANLQEVFEALAREPHNTLRDLGVQLRCGADAEETGMPKRPYCMALRDAGPYEALVKDPHYLSELKNVLGDVLGPWAEQNIYCATGIGADQASALLLFQMAGCYTAAMSCNDDVAWEKTRVSIDAFIRAGLGGLRQQQPME